MSPDRRIFAAAVIGSRMARVAQIIQYGTSRSSARGEMILIGGITVSGRLFGCVLQPVSVIS